MGKIMIDSLEHLDFYVPKKRSNMNIIREGLKGLFENKDKKLIRDVVKTNPEVRKFTETHPDYQVKRDRKFPAASLKDLQVLLNYGSEWLQSKACAAAVEEVRALLRSGGHPESLADQTHLENLALFEVMGAPELTTVEEGGWTYAYKNTYTVESLRVYVDSAKNTAVIVTPPVKRTYEKRENSVVQEKRCPKKVPYHPGRLWRAANLP